MNKYNIRLGIIVAVVAGFFTMHQYYYSPTQVSQRQMKAYQDEINVQSWTVAKKRLDREQLKKDFESRDSTLSGEINESKNRIEILENCIKANAFPCEKANKKAISFLVNSAYASDDTPKIIPQLPKKERNDVVLPFRNSFACDKRLKTTAIEYHFTAENYDQQDTNEKKLLAIWNAHTSKNGRVQWDGIGYHYVITQDGTVYNTRNEDCRAIADAWYEKQLMSNENTEHVHIAFIWDDKPNKLQTQAMISLGQWLINKYGLTRNDITSHAENAPKSLKESLKWWYGSDENFTKNFTDSQDKIISVLRNWVKNDAATYAWNTYKDMDFMLTIDAESGWDISQVGDSGNAFWLCQLNKIWHKDKIEEYSSRSTQWKVDYCRQLYVMWKKDWVLPNMLHWYNNRMTRSQYITFQ